MEIPDDLAERFVKTFSEPDLPNDTGGGFSCIDAETIADVLRAFGAPEVAKHWIDGHGGHDYPGDEHYQGEESEPLEA